MSHFKLGLQDATFPALRWMLPFFVVVFFFMSTLEHAHLIIIAQYYVLGTG